MCLPLWRREERFQAERDVGSSKQKPSLQRHKHRAMVRSRNPQPSQEQREGAVQVGRGLGLNTSLHVGTWLSPHGVHLPRRRVASANDFSKETGDGQSAGQSRDAPLDAESHRQHRRGRAPSPVPEGWGVTADTAETWMQRVITDTAETCTQGVTADAAETWTWGVTLDTAETWAWGVTTALESMSPEPPCQRAGESPQT